MYQLRCTIKVRFIKFNEGVDASPHLLVMVNGEINCLLKNLKNEK